MQQTTRTRACFSEQMTAYCLSVMLSEVAVGAVGDDPLFTLPADCCPAPSQHCHMAYIIYQQDEEEKEDFA